MKAQEKAPARAENTEPGNNQEHSEDATDMVDGKPIDLNTLEDQAPKGFAPGAVFYDSPCGGYLVDGGTSFYRWSKRNAVLNGLRRWHAAEYGMDDKESALAAKSALDDRELDGAVQWAGSIAGHKRGKAFDTDGLPILILSEAKLVNPVAGRISVIGGIIRQAFPDDDQCSVMLGWLATRLRAVRAGIHCPAPMLVIAGPVNAGKSLIAWIVTQLLGGRVANPHAAWTGGILWNDNLIGAELLLIDDCIGSTDIRSRRSLAAKFKEAMYPAQIDMRKRHSSSIAIRPVWAVMVCCNDTPESLQIIPPLDADMSDKVIMLRAEPIKPPVDDPSTPEGKRELRQLIRAELPAMAAFLETFEIPDHLRDSRAGITAWRHPELAGAIESTSPARRLEELLSIALLNEGIWNDLPCDMVAAEIEARLLNHENSMREQARGLFYWHGACGSALAKLATMENRHVTCGEYDGHRKTPRYRITR